MPLRSLPQKRGGNSRAVNILIYTGLIIVMACQFVGISRATFYRTERDLRKADVAVIDAINPVLEKSPRAAF
jgi:putative transposase